MSASESDIQPSDGVESVNGIGPSRGETLRQNGIETVEDLQEASQETLAGYVPGNVAESVKKIVGNRRRNIPNVANAKQKAREIPGAISKTVRIDGRQVSKVLEKEQEQHSEGATIEIHKG